MVHQNIADVRWGTRFLCDDFLDFSRNTC